MKRIVLEKSMYTKCPNCNKDFDVTSDEEKYFNCPHCGSSFKYLDREYKRNDLCIFCKWHRRVYMSYDVGNCYFNTKNVTQIDIWDYDYDKNNFDEVNECNTTCDKFEVKTIGKYNSEDNSYTINKSYKVSGYYGFWWGLNSFRYDICDIDNIPNDCLIILNELSKGEIYSILKSEFIEKCTIYDDTYYLSLEFWDVIYKPIEVEMVKEYREDTNNDNGIQFTHERFMALCERVRSHNICN